MKELGIGVIGFGFMGRTHTYGIKTIPLYYQNLPFIPRLAGVCDVNRAAADKAKAEQGFAFATDSVDELLARDDIHAVTISTPNIYHKQDVIKALKAGKHIYCDKPLATTTAESREIGELVRDTGLITQMALQYRFFPTTMRAKQLIDEGRIGRVMSFRASYLHSGSVDATKRIGWKQDKKFGGGGVLLDLGSHVLDLMYALLGEFAEIFAETRIVYPQRPDKSGTMIDIDADDLILMLVKMPDGGLGTVEASKIATGTNDEMRVEIHGDKGALRFNLMDPNWLEFYDNTLPERALGGDRGFTRIECVQRFEKPGGDFPSSKFSIGWIRAHVHCLYSFLDCVHRNERAKPSFLEGAYIQQVMDAAYKSCHERRWQTV